MNKQHTFRKFAYLGLILFLVIVILYSGLRVLESTVFYREDLPQETVAKKTISIDGAEYFPRQDITTLLVCGIDQTGPMESSNTFNNAGCADMISLIIFDEANENIRVIALNRDTMTDVPVLAINGQVSRTRYEQIALSHSYGSGLHDSSENVVRAVSSLIHNVPIDHYITLNMDAIQILNDAVGGVTVTVNDDFSHIDESLTKGKVTLHGSQAVHYIRSRHDVGDQLNISRMERHKSYISGFMEALHTTIESDNTKVLTTYEKLSPYMVSDCSGTVLNTMVSRYQNYPIVEYVSPEGENIIGTTASGEQHYEFHIDEASMDDLIIRTLYTAK